MRPHLDIELGVDGRGFAAGLNRVASGVNAQMVGVGRQMGQRVTSGFLSIISYLSVTRLMSQLSMWGRDSDAMAERYREMGIVIEDGMVKQLRDAGREIERMNLEIQKNTLPLILKVSQVIVAIMEMFQRNAAFVRGFAGGLKVPKVTMKDVALNVFRPFHLAEKILKGTNWGEAALLGTIDKGIWDFNHIMRLTKEMNWRPTPEEEEEKTEKSTRISRASRTGLAGIGGTVGLLEDRVFRIEQEQLRQLKAIEANTKKSNSGTFAL